MRRHILLFLLFSAPTLFAAGTLTPKGSSKSPIQIHDHSVNVIIDNGFAKTEVTQVFFNPNDEDLEAVYGFPVPASASLSEITIWNRDRTLTGEVIEAEAAKKVYTEEREAGNDAGLGECSCTKSKSDIEYSSYKFSISPVRAKSETKIRFVYYQPLKIESGVGRYVYPLAEGGTDDAASSFWTRNPVVEKHFGVHVDLRSGWPVDEVRTPEDHEATVTKRDAGHYEVALARTGNALNRDFVFYYRLAENLPGRVELMTYKPNANEPGTFMLTVTPGSDLSPIGPPIGIPAAASVPGTPLPETAMTYSESMTVSSTAGADYVFVLDVSGSMDSKLPVLARGVQQALTHFQTGDRFRIFAFSENARELTHGFVDASAPSIAEWSQKVQQLHTESGTNVYEGLKAGLDAVEADRTTSILFVTDGVANEGIVDPREFANLLKKYDVRVFGFLMGNNANWPLMRLIAETSGGFYDPVSNDDDILGAILLAKSKITSEAMHDARLTIEGVKTFDRTDDVPSKIYRGQQLVIFGRYEGGGPAGIKLAAKMSGPDATYATNFEFPAVSTEYPELERMYALDRIEHAIMKETAGVASEDQTRTIIRDLGLRYQLVTDYTSMVVLGDDGFARHGIGRDNRQRIEVEQKAQAARSGAPRNLRADSSQPMFRGSSHTTRGGGAIDPITAMLGLIAVFAVVALREKLHEER